MTENGPDSLILRFLRQIDDKLDHQTMRIDALTGRISSLEKQIALIFEILAIVNNRMDGLERECRLDRIERRQP